MQDRDIPPVEEGRTNGVEDGVRPNEAPEARWAATANRDRESIPLPWTTTIGQIWAATMAAGVEDVEPASVRPMLRWNLNPCLPSMKTLPRASLRSSRTSSFWPRFRRLDGK